MDTKTRTGPPRADPQPWKGVTDARHPHPPHHHHAGAGRRERHPECPCAGNRRARPRHRPGRAGQPQGATVAELAAITGLGTSTVGKALTAAETDGKVTRVPGGRDGARRAPDTWTLPTTAAQPTTKTRATADTAASAATPPAAPEPAAVGSNPGAESAPDAGRGGAAPASGAAAAAPG